MTARMQAQLAVVALSVVALALGGVLVFRGHASSAGAPDAGSCDDHTVPGPLLPSADDTPLLLWPEKGARLTIDGAAVLSQPDDPRRFTPGEHKVRVECAGAGTAEHRFFLDAYQPAGIYAECRGEPEFIFLGVACRSCAAGSVPDETAARAQAAKSPKGSGLRTISEAQQVLQRREAQRQRSVLVQRWNLLTDRYFRVLGALGHEATDAVDSAHFRFEALSKGVSAAEKGEDAIGLDESVRAGEETLSVLVKAARSAHPTDCEFQERLTRAF